MAKKEKVKLTTPIFRVAFPHVFEATAFKNKDGSEGKKTFNLVAIFTPADYTGKEKERWDALKAQLDSECKRKFGKSWGECKKVDPETGEKGVRDFKDGIYNGKRKADMDGYGDGTWYCTLSSIYPPGVVKYNGPGKESTDISVEDNNTDEIYAGCYARATVGVYAYGPPDSPSSGVSVGLNRLQKVKDGERLDGRGSAANDFEDDIDSSFLDQDEEPVGEEDPFK